MFGMILWKNHVRGRSPVQLGECCVLHVRFACAEIDRGTGPLLRRRVRKAVRRLSRQGITEVVLPKDFPWPELLEEAGMKTVSTLPLRQRLAADWLRLLLEERGLTSPAIRVAVAAERLTGELVRVVTELSLRYRYVLLDPDQGGQELTRQLQREYGVSLLLHPTVEQAEAAEAAVLFSPRKDWSGGNRVWLPLYDEALPLPALALPPVLEEQLPEGADRGQLLAALYQAGALRPGQLTVLRAQFEKSAAKQVPKGKY